MNDVVRYEYAAQIATLTIDDGKANVMSSRMLAALNDALDRAERDEAVVLLQGREGMFSAGYDMAMFGRGAGEIVSTIKAGGQLVERLLGFPRPVIAACTGHAIAQGAFLLLAADVRIGGSGRYKVGLNEVAIGLTIPHYGVEAARLRMPAPWFNHATTTGALYSPQEAHVAGFLDRVVEPEQLKEAVAAEAERLKTLNPEAHRNTKARVRKDALERIREGIEVEFAEAAV